MRSTIRLPVEEIIPRVSAVLEAQGLPAGIRPDERIAGLAAEAISLFARLAEPAGVVMEVAKDDFEDVFEGEGRNRDRSPVGPICRASDRLALFAVTIGPSVCDEIRGLFGRNDFALGAMLDSVASEGTEMAAQVIESNFRARLSSAGEIGTDRGILRFSPGYCGWHIGAQRKLFRLLQPEEVGITLNSSFLMTPIKSISGVAVMGRKEIFMFRDDFPFCDECDTHPCRERMRSVFTQ